ncbi:MAG: TolC family protein [Nitrospiraceae bacterium]|nr:TolC family protein [Nitrospiraceae bacterium]
MPPPLRSVGIFLWTTFFLVVLWIAPSGGESVLAEPSIETSSERFFTATLTPSMQSLRLSLDEAMGLFLKQNVDLLIAKFGIEFSKGREITASLFPNPVTSVGAVSSPFQGRTWSSGGQIVPQVQQLFELAGKRGFRIDSAQFGTQSAEAGFEDAVRQLSLAVKDAYYRTQLALRRLTLAEENRDRFSRILEINTIRFKKGFIAEVDLIRIRLQFIDFQSQVIQSIQEAESARSDLRQLLRLSPATQVELTTELMYRRLDPDIARLRTVAMDARPDLRAKRLTVSQREADLDLAKAYRVPDVTVGAGYAVQGSRGPDNSNQMALSLALPLPLFNRNQGGIMQAEAAVQTAEADLIKTVNQVENQVDIAYRNLVQSRRLVEAFLGGVLDDARSTLTIVERAYERGGATILDLLDAARTSRMVQQNYIEALFNYQRNVLQLESAVGRDLTS